jgi:hypothetical protein
MTYRRQLLLAFILIIFCAMGIAQTKHKNIVQFYPFADSVARYPDLSKRLKIVRQKLVEGKYVSFISQEGDKKVTIVAVTDSQIAEVDSSIFRVVKFKGLQALDGKITTWGYVFDRNNDGKIDYLELLGGAAPFEWDSMPDNFPVRGKRLTLKEWDLFVSHCMLIFNHWADDNYDGSLDAVIQADMDPYRDWVNRMIVVRSTKFNGKFNDVWGFQNSITQERDTVSCVKNRVPYHPIALPPSEITEETFKQKSAILQLINRAAALAGLKKGSFVTGEEEDEDQ